MVVLRFYLEYVIDIYNHTIPEKCFTSKELEDHLKYAIVALKSVMFGNPKFVMDTRYRLIGYFLCCNIKSYDRHSQFSLPNFENTVLIPKWA